ncbi:hypothetical protein DITRI_Ditri17bG0105600 [Diplodiscus trichospermus]
MGSHAAAWLDEDESAREMLDRVLTERPFLLLRPLHRVPLRVGNIVELVGPSSSAKTHILIQAAITCILPSEWKGINYGGLGHLAMFLDLDCRFDILRFSELLNHRIMEAANGSSGKVDCHKKDSEAQNATMKPYNEELFALCMRRFLYIRCYDSSEFLATLKTLHYRLQKEREAQGVNVHFLLIDSIGAFHWIDRGSLSFSLEGDNRKSLHLQSVSETVVQEIRKLLLVHPMLVMATKVAVLANRNYRKWSAMDNPYSRNVASSDQQLPYHEYMPAVWQSFVTHRVLVRITDDDFVDGEHHSVPTYLLEWLLPPLNSLDKFTVTDSFATCRLVCSFFPEHVYRVITCSLHSSATCSLNRCECLLHCWQLTVGSSFTVGSFDCLSGICRPRIEAGAGANGPIIIIWRLEVQQSPPLTPCLLVVYKISVLIPVVMLLDSTGLASGSFLVECPEFMKKGKSTKNMAELGNEHFVTTVTEDHENTCWGCGLRLLLPTYAPVFKCGWCGAITNQNVNKPGTKCLWWRRLRDRCFVCILIIFMLFVICGGVWAVYPVVFSVSYTCGIVHSILTIIFSATTVSTFSLAAFQCAGTPPIILWGSYPVVGKGGLENYTFCHYCSKPKSPRTHHCCSCGMCVLDMDHHCPFGYISGHH